MKILLVNLPYPEKIIRRFSCTYHAKGFLFPPLELNYIYSNINKKHDIKIIDCIAENVKIEKLVKIIEDSNFDLIVTLVGIESFEHDIKFINEIKQKNLIKIIAFGYYPTLFPKKILKNSSIDIIVINEPEKIIKETVDKLSNNISLNKQEGIAYKIKNKIIINPKKKRISDLNQINFPKLLENSKYKDLFSKDKFTTILTSRGCPFNCDFCIQTYGKEYHRRNNHNIIEELKYLIKEKNIKNIRFMDDTFNMSERLTIDLCNMIKKNKIKFKWSCLCRLDLLNEKIISAMKSAGCYRIYFGIESLNEKNYEYFGKKSINSENKIKLLRKYKIETFAWFLVGFYNDNKKNIKEYAKKASKLKLDFAIASQIIPYPGTNFFNNNKNKIKFSLFPYYQLEYKKENLEKTFYFNYYFNIIVIFRTLKFLIKYSLSNISLIPYMIKYLFSKNKNIRKSFI